jgi:predicted metal-dependent enzyme (double-stranded beta helix superfamily)
MPECNEMIKKLQHRCREITKLPEQEKMLAARDLIAQSITSSDWLEDKHYEVEPKQGYSLHTIYLSKDCPFGMFVVAWLPHRGAPPHTHGGWTVIGGLVGAETNTLWRRVDDGSEDGVANIEIIEKPVIGPAEVLVMPGDDDIHSVFNDSDEVTVTLHAYAIQPNIANRWTFDPDANTVQRFVTNTVQTCTGSE